MPKAADNTVRANAEAIKKRAREGVGQPRTEWRVDGQPGLIFVTRPTGSASFYAFYNPTFGTKRRKLKLGDFPAMTLAEAIQSARDVRAEVGRGADPALDRQRQKASLTFKAMAERFLAEGSLSAITRQGYDDAFRKDVYPAIGDKPATAVTADDVLAICEKIAKRGAGVQPQRTKGAIGGAYRWGIAKLLVKRNPAREVPNQEQYKSERKRVPTDDEIAALWNALDKTRTSKPMKIIIRLGILLGQRRKEIAGAKVSELEGLDTDKPVWVIPASEAKAGRLVEEGRMKNKKEQRVYLSRQAAALFDEARKTTANDTYLFPPKLTRTRKTTRVPHINRESISKAVRRLGVEDVVFHDLRRAITTYLADHDVPDKVLSMLLHHTDGSVTGEHYDKAKRERQLREAWQLWADHVTEVVGR